jgi:hypothetical protein
MMILMLKILSDQLNDTIMQIILEARRVILFTLHERDSFTQPKTFLPSCLSIDFDWCLTPYHSAYSLMYIRGCIQKFPDPPSGARTANGTALCH